jgi:hypothetical protein
MLELVLTSNDSSAGIPRMTKTRIAIVALVLSFTAAVFCFGAAKTADPAASPAAAKPAKAMAPKKEAAAAANAHIGTWKVNAAKSKFAPGMGKTNTVMYAEKKDQIQVTIDGVGADGKPTHGVWTGKTDGKSYKVKGNLAWDAMAYKMVDDRTYDITAMKSGKVSWSGRSAVAKDGKSRTLNMSGTGADGKKFKAKTVYDKA